MRSPALARLHLMAIEATQIAMAFEEQGPFSDDWEGLYNHLQTLHHAVTRNLVEVSRGMHPHELSEAARCMCIVEQNAKGVRQVLNTLDQLTNVNLC